MGTDHSSDSPSKPAEPSLGLESLDSAVEDAALLDAVRAGDPDAYGTLWERHSDAARALARTLVRDPADVEDLVAETFAKVLAKLRAGQGPQLAFRAYLSTTLRHVCYHRVRRDRRLQFTDDLTRYDVSEPFPDPTLAALEQAYAARAFRKLPARWREVLWRTEVEGATPSQVAPLLGLTPNAAAVLAHRAREGLRQGYLREHLAGAASADCRWTSDRLGGYLRARLSARERTKVGHHLARCRQCALRVGELSEVNGGRCRVRVRHARA
ncbi:MULTISPECIES: sigma-70 family RNA polymerase sigma factor [Catenuloplanes]|uniref:RNA polymerase sigma factor (Sigma-70 family) n=1 Tax=Catenuloplanes niger TaxID=587534 RepID=A0AAE3ZUB6_9ACTN|nr:sigma-70 family RNA polymerase sigma factor [Catenuloplanes niger]MDR7324323.1 RNA polymerase sigma factor (sigma-70 family) [Catenuloplanes niger]